MTTIRKLLGILTARERVRAALLLVMIMIMALLEMVGVASVMPFIAVLANPDAVLGNSVLARFYELMEFTDPQRFLFFLGAMVFVALVISIGFKALTTYAQLRFSLMREYSIAERLVTGYLHQPYEWFLDRHSADLDKNVLSEVSIVIHGTLIPIMQLIAHGAVALALLMLLLVVDYRLALMAGGVLGLAYGLIYTMVRRYLGRIGTERLEANRMRFAALSEAFGGIKELKVRGLEASYIERFGRPAKVFASHQASSLVIAQMPRFVLEAVAFGGMLLVVLYLLAGVGGLARALPIIALYAFAGYRLIPALQVVYGSFTQLRFAGAALDALHSDVNGLTAPPEPEAVGASSVSLRRAITLRNVSYTYPNGSRQALVDLNLSIPARCTVGLVGATGSGKTTAVDLILGLLEPQEGVLSVDDTPIGPVNRRQWQRSIGYVPQHIYLADDSIAVNIAFGVAPDLIDPSAVEKAARIANLHSFVTTELPAGYATTVGERGVRLSGGQRQRIGIARALYHQPEVLIMDEATSALDSLTEQAVMEAVHNLGRNLTVILIAHRLSTVRECDQIYFMRGGRVVAQGTYDELVKRDESFRAMALL